MRHDLFHQIAWGFFILAGISGFVMIITANSIFGYITLGFIVLGIVADFIDYLLNYRG